MDLILKKLMPVHFFDNIQYNSLSCPPADFKNEPLILYIGYLSIIRMPVLIYSKNNNNMVLKFYEWKTTS